MPEVFGNFEIKLLRKFPAVRYVHHELVSLLNNSHPLQSPLNFMSAPGYVPFSSYSHVGPVNRIVVPTIVELPACTLLNVARYLSTRETGSPKGGSIEPHGYVPMHIGIPPTPIHS